MADIRDFRLNTDPDELPMQPVAQMDKEITETKVYMNVWLKGKVVKPTNWKELLVDAIQHNRFDVLESNFIYSED